MTVQGLESLLREQAFLTGLSAEQAAFLAGCARNARFHAGDYLMREGCEANAFFLIRTGRVALEIDVPGRGPVQMESLGAGDVLGLSWLVPPYREHLDARAVEPVVALVFEGTCLRDKLDADHDLGFVLTRRLFEHAYRRLERVRLQRLDVYGGR